jgi:metallo-beta-lactamase class B
MLTRLFLLLAAAVAAFAQKAIIPSSPEWTRPFPPFKIIGNVYWVGTYDLSTYLITTPRGNILINTGLESTVPQITSGIEKLGFKVSDTKILLAMHGHWDHVAGLAELKRLTGAKMIMSKADTELLESGGKSDFYFGGSPEALFPPVKVDQKLKDGDKVALGGMELTAHMHPGHTKGSTTFTFDVREAGKTYRVGLVNLPRINVGVHVSAMPKFPEIAEAYARTFRLIRALDVDIWLSSHASHFGLHEKIKPGDPYDPERFADPSGLRVALDRLESMYLDQLARERAGK